MPTTARIAATEITRTGYFYKIIYMLRSINLCVLRDAYHELFVSLWILCVRDARRKGNKITANRCRIAPQIFRL